MTIESWTLVVEAIGAAGIIITLGYLAVQVRQNNNHLAAQARWNLNQQRSSMIQSMWRDPDVSALMDRAARQEPLEPVDEKRLYWLSASVVNQWAYDWKEHSLGNLSMEDLPVTRMRSAFGGAIPRLPQWWESKTQYEKYLAWRTESGFLGRIVEHLSESPSIQYYDHVDA